MAIVRWTNPFLPTAYRDWFPRALFLGELSDFLPRSDHFVPRMDVYGEGGDLVVKLELPEFKADDIEVSLEDSCLTISGKHEREEKIEEEHYYRRERYSGAFTRTVQLPRQTKEEDVSADLKEGVLEVRVKGAAAEAAVEDRKKIPVASS